MKTLAREIDVKIKCLKNSYSKNVFILANVLYTENS